MDDEAFLGVCEQGFNRADNPVASVDGDSVTDREWLFAAEVACGEDFVAAP